MQWSSIMEYESNDRTSCAMPFHHSLFLNNRGGVRSFLRSVSANLAGDPPVHAGPSYSLPSSAARMWAEDMYLSIWPSAGRGRQTQELRNQV